MKKIFALLLVLALAFSFTACGGDDSNSAADGSTASPATSEATAENNLETKYGISLTAEGVQTLSAERATKDVLIETKDTWLGGKMSFALDTEQKTYDDFVKHIGCDASTYSYNASKGERSFTWIAEGDETAQFLAVFWETTAGWTLYIVGSTNLS